MPKATPRDSTPQYDSPAEPSRRGFLSAAASVAAVSAAAAISVDQALASTADARLFELGRKIEDLEVRYKKANDLLWPLCDRHRERMDAWIEANPHRPPSESYDAVKHLWAAEEAALGGAEGPDVVMSEADPS